MAQIISPKKTVEYLRKKDPYASSSLTDEQLYDYAQQKYPDFDWPVWPEKQKIAKEKQVDLMDQDTSPNIFSTLGTYSLSQHFADDSKYFADTYNKSSAGLLYQAIHGKQRYDVGEYHPDTLGEIAQFFIGHLAPLDIALFFGSGAIGGKVAQSASKRWLTGHALKGLEGATEQTAKNVFMKDAIATGAISSGIGLGMYGAAGGTLAESARQSTEKRNGLRDEYDMQEIMLQGAKQGLHSAALGAVSGGLVKGSMGSQYGFAKMKGFDSTFKDQATKYLMNPAAQILAEANAFTVGEFIGSEEELNFKNYIRGVARNTGIIGGIKVFSPSFWRGQSEDLNRLVKQTKKFADADAESRALKRVKDGYEKDIPEGERSHHDVFVGETLAKEVAKKQMKHTEKLEGLESLSIIHKNLAKISSNFPKDMKEAQEIVNKAVDKGYDKLTKREKEILNDVDYWLSESNAYNDIMFSLYKEFSNNKNEYYRMLESEKGKPLTESEKRQADIHLKTTMDQMLSFHDFTNAIARGDKPVLFPEGEKFKIWQERLQEAIDGKKPAAPEKPITKPQVEEIKKLINQAANKMGKTPEEVRKDTNFHDVEGNPSIELLKDFLDKPSRQGEGVSFKTNEEFKKTKGLKLGVDQKRKNVVDRLDAEAEKRNLKNAENQNQIDNFETSKGVIRSVLQRHIVKASGGPGGEKGAGIWALTDQKSREHVNNMFNFAEFLAKKGRNLSNATMNDAKDFLTGKASTVGNSFNYFHDKYFKHHNKNLKDAIASEILKYTEFKKSAMQGARFSDVNHSKNEVTIWPSKGTNKDPINIGVSEGLTSVIKLIEGYVKKNIPSERLTWRDADGIQHEFIFWNDNKMPIVREDVNKIFNFFTGSGKGNINNLRSIHPENFRKAFISWAETVYKGDAQLTQVIDQLRLAHKTGDMTQFYKIWGGDAKAKLTEASSKFINEIFGDKIPEVRAGTKEATAHELRLLVENIKEYAKQSGTDHLRIKNDIIHKDQVLGMLRYALETSARWTDIAPKKHVLFKGSIDFPFERVSTSKLINKKVKNAKAVGIINSWENGVLPNTVKNLKDYIKAKKDVGEKITQKQAKAKHNERIVEDKTKLNPVVTETLVDKPMNRLEYIQNKLDQNPKYQKLREKFLASKGKERKQASQEMLKMEKDMTNTVPVKEKGFDYRQLGEGKFQVLPQGSPAIKSVINQLLKREIRKNPGLKVWLNEKGSNKDYSGKFYDGIIELTLGKANEQTFFHENAHRFKEFVNKIGNTELASLITRGEKMFVKEARKAGQSREEYFTDRMADYGTGMSKGVVSKMKNWGKLMLSKLKKYIFGTDKLSKNDLARLLGAEVYKGFDTRGIKMMGKNPKYQFANEADAIKQTRSDFNYLMNDLGLKGNIKAKDAMKKVIASDLENPQQFIKVLFKQGKTYEGFMEDVSLFMENMQAMNVPKLNIIADKAKWYTSFRQIENLRVRKAYNITKDMLAEDMKRLGVKSGNIWDATTEQLQRYAGYLKTIEFPNEPIRAYLSQYELSGIEVSPLKAQLYARALPVDIFLEKIGLRTLADKMRSHGFLELDHIGKGYVSFENDIKEIYGKFKAKVPFKLQAIKDKFWLLDKKRYEDAKADGTLSSSDKRFIEKALDKDGKPNLENVEGKLADRYKKFTKYYKDAYLDALREVMTEAQFEKYIDGGNIKWIEDGFYVSRILTKQFKRKFNLGSKETEKYIETESWKLAGEEASKKYGTIFSKEQQGEFLETAKAVIRSSIYDMMNLSTTKVSSRFLKRRHLKLPEKIDGIKVYETSYDKTAKVYAASMSKFIANVTYFPEFVSMNGFYYPGAKAALQKLKQHDPKWGEFVVGVLETQLGKHKGNPFEYEQRLMQATSNTLAKLGLSFPTSGLKNLALGTTQTGTAFKLRDMALGFVKVLNKQDRESVRGTGATEMSLRYLETGGLDRFLDSTLFKFGMMKPTEFFNRYLSVLTSRVEQERLVSIIRDKNIKNASPKKYNKAMNRLKEFYKLNEKDIALLEKYGMEGVKGEKLRAYDIAVENRRIKSVFQKMDSMAHIKTQGASLDLFMPEWAGRQGIKPLTLYKRMAYAATVNTYENTKWALKNGEMMKLLVHGAGTALTGATMMAIGKEFLGQSPPKENDSWLTRMQAMFWRGEFLGFLSGLLNPDGLFKGIGDMVTPAIWENAENFAVESYRGIKGFQTGDQTFNAIAKRSVSAYNGLLNVWDAKNNKYKTDSKRWAKLKRDFEKEFKVQEEVKYAKNLRSPYYKGLKLAFESGTEKEFAEQYLVTIFAVANDMLNEGYTKKLFTLDQALKEAEKIVNNKIKNFNPNPSSFYKQSNIAQLRALDFSKWILDGMGKQTLIEMQRTEQEYNTKVERFMKTLPFYLRQFNLKNMFSKHIKSKKMKSIS